MSILKGFNSSMMIRTLSPLSPSPYEGEGELLERGVSPLLYTPFSGRMDIKTTVESPFSGYGIADIGIINMESPRGA